MIILSYCSPLSVSRLSLQVKIFQIQFCQLYLESHPNYGVKTILAKAVPEGLMCYPLRIHLAKLL